MNLPLVYFIAEDATKNADYYQLSKLHVIKVFSPWTETDDLDHLTDVTLKILVEDPNGLVNYTFRYKIKEVWSPNENCKVAYERILMCQGN